MYRLAPAMFLLLYSLQSDVAQADNVFKGAPENLTSSWGENSITIQSSREQYGRIISDSCFIMVMSLKTMKAQNWQINITSTRCITNYFSRKCYFSKPSLDEEKCYEMQVRFQVHRRCLGSPPSSNWSQIVILKNGSLSDSCPGDQNSLTEEQMELQRLVIILFSVILSVMFFAIIILGCVIKRVKKLFPLIPDPKNAFPNLYDHHSRYLQEWMKTSKYNAQLEEIESVLEEQDEEEESTYKKTNETATLENQYVIEEPVATVTTAPFVESVSDTSFANINFTMNDSAYIML